MLVATIEAHPRRFELAARELEAGAWHERSRSWLAAPASLSFSYLSDEALDDVGQREYSAGIELPLWRSNQRQAARAVASSATDEAAAAVHALRLEVAGALRQALWDIAAAEDDLGWAEDSLAVANELVRIVERRHAVGDLPQADVLLAETARFERQKSVIESEAALLDAERAYRSLTGLGRRPAEFAEELSPREDFDADHPLLALADSEVERARARTRFVTTETRGHPTVTIGPQRQRDPFGALYTDSLTLDVSVPIGGRHAGISDRAEAARLTAEAQSRRADLMRRMDLALHEAQHELLVVTESLLVAEQQLELAERHWAMGRSAFEQGEVELRELLRIQDGAQSASREVTRLRIERQRAIAAVNHALGDIP